jgi:hypothetical protein
MSLLASLKNAKAKYSRNAADSYRLKEGKTRLRIIPYIGKGKQTGPNGEFHCDVGVHWIKTALGGKPVAVVGDCETTYGTHNPINDAIDAAAQVAKTVDDEMVKLVSEWKARKSVLMNALIRTKGSSDASEDEVKILELTPTTFGDLCGKIETFIDEGGAAEDEVLSLSDGIDIIIEKTGRGMDTRYSVMPAPGKSAPVDPSVVEKVNDLPEFIRSRYFRGEEQKALSAIEAVTGISAPRLGVRPATAMLTSRAEETASRTTAPATVKEAPAAAPVKEVAPVATAPKTAVEADAFNSPLPDSEVDALLAQLDLP